MYLIVQYCFQNTSKAYIHVKFKLKVTRYVMWCSFWCRTCTTHMAQFIV